MKRSLALTITALFVFALAGTLLFAQPPQRQLQVAALIGKPFRI